LTVKIEFIYYKKENESMKKFVQKIIIFFAFATSLSALDFSLRLTPNLLFPTSKLYNTSFGGVGQFDVNFLNLISVGVEGFVDVNNPASFNKSVPMFGGGLGVGAFYYPISRLYVGAGGAFGGADYIIPQKKENTENEYENVLITGLYYRGYGEIGFRVSPTFTVNAVGGYSSYMTGKTTVVSGPFAGVSAKINLEIGKKSSGDISASLEQYDNIYPLFTALYRADSVGSISITNFESAEIRNVHVSFRAGKYTASMIECGSISMVKKFQTVEVPFLADFSSEILNFSENGQISGEVVIDYEFLGKKRQSVENVIISVNNRNAYLWGNEDALAAFVSPDTPEVLELAKYVSGIERNNLYTGMNRNIQFTAAMIEGLRLSGITYSADTISPYKSFHKGEELDSIQYPLQTMNCLSGDYDDLGILLASCLESVGVSTGFLPVDDDFLVLVNIAVKPTAAKNHFTSTEGLVMDDNKVFFALAMSEFENGYTSALTKGSQIVKAIKESGMDCSYIDVEEAWSVYSPVVYTKNGKSFTKPSQSELEKATKVAIDNYINSELLPLVENIKKNGNDNQIGLAYMRAGKYSDAKACFTKSANAGNVSGMNNLANILFTEKDYAGAAAQYKKVLTKDPENKTALSGLEKANSKISQ